MSNDVTIGAVMRRLQGVETIMTTIVENQKWQEGFNQATFINFGPDPVSINNFPVLVNQQFTINLNVGEVNVTNYNIDFGASAVGTLWIIYTIYMQ